VRKIFVISDLHINHFNIIRYTGRPFLSEKHQTDTIVTRWNSTVSSNDEIIVCGDFAFINKDFDSSIINTLKGHKILIIGNHDRKSKNYYSEHGFDFVCESLALRDILFTHYPLDEIFPLHVVKELLCKYQYNIHGHIHEKETTNTRFINVSVEQKYMNYTPILLDRLISLKEKNKI
jgi:calcineurin-like phosphoesterase family protein